MLIALASASLVMFDVLRGSWWMRYSISAMIRWAVPAIMGWATNIWGSDRFPDHGLGDSQGRGRRSKQVLGLICFVSLRRSDCLAQWGTNVEGRSRP